MNDRAARVARYFELQRFNVLNCGHDAATVERRLAKIAAREASAIAGEFSPTWDELAEYEAQFSQRYGCPVPRIVSIRTEHRPARPVPAAIARITRRPELPAVDVVLVEVESYGRPGPEDSRRATLEFPASEIDPTDLAAIQVRVYEAHIDNIQSYHAGD